MVYNISEHFKRSEFACKCGCGFDTVDYETLLALEHIRRHFDRRVIINSGCRCEAHNKEIKGSPHSQHLIGRAADIVVKDIPPVIVADYIEWMYSDTFGIGRYKRFTHIDSRTKKARWR